MAIGFMCSTEITVNEKDVSYNQLILKMMITIYPKNIGPNFGKKRVHSHSSSSPRNSARCGLFNWKFKDRFGRCQRLENYLINLINIF